MNWIELDEAQGRVDGEGQWATKGGVLRQGQILKWISSYNGGKKGKWG